MLEKGVGGLHHEINPSFKNCQTDVLTNIHFTQYNMWIDSIMWQESKVAKLRYVSFLYSAGYKKSLEKQT